MSETGKKFVSLLAGPVSDRPRRRLLCRHRQCSSRNCAADTGDGERNIRSVADAVFGKAITSRMLGVPARSHSAVNPGGDAPVGRRAILERFQQVAELLLRFLWPDAERLEHRLLLRGGGFGCCRRPLPSRPSPDHRLSPDRAGIALQQRPIFVHGRGEGVMHGAPAALLRAPFEQRKFHDPTRRVKVVVDQAKLVPQGQAQITQARATTPGSRPPRSPPGRRQRPRSRSRITEMIVSTGRELGDGRLDTAIGLAGTVARPLAPSAWRSRSDHPLVCG